MLDILQRVQGNPEVSYMDSEGAFCTDVQSLKHPVHKLITHTYAPSVCLFELQFEVAIS